MAQKITILSIDNMRNYISDNYQDNLFTQKHQNCLIKAKIYCIRYFPVGVTIIPLKSAETGRPKRSKRSVL